MVDWGSIVDQASYYWQEFLNWFLNIPIYGQVLVIVGAVAALILVGVLVYYILKGVGYLVYYILKGVYYLLKGIALGLYKLFEEFYYAITGKPKPIKTTQKEPPIQEEALIIKQIQNEIKVVPPNVVYCSECGNSFSELMNVNLAENGIAYCVYCGQGFQVAPMVTVEL